MEPTNLQPYSVGELAGALKRTVETNFAVVRVRGELTSVKGPHASGHWYFQIKDTDACIDTVVWRGSVRKLQVQPESGLEVIITGRLSTFEKSSRYQLIVEGMELAGEGALLKLLEDRKRRLQAEGLFEASRKRPLPVLPAVIGVVTSPSGAVIRDILHRLEDRFPRHVLVWPVAVQGPGAAEQIAAAIEGFNRLDAGGPVPRPDVLIVARGGGSLEDLMAFNEEIVVRAAAASAIPLISAVGHETDITLIDFAADRRAPTPTAAAEFAVPVRAELLARTTESGARLTAAAMRGVEQQRLHVTALARGLTHPRQALQRAEQQVDDLLDRLSRSARTTIDLRMREVAALGARLRPPQAQAAEQGRVLQGFGERLQRASLTGIEQGQRSLAALTPRLRAPSAQHLQATQSLETTTRRLAQALGRVAEREGGRLARAGDLLESTSYRRVLERGFALVTDAEGHPVTGKAQARGAMTLEFHDGKVGVVAGDAPPKRKSGDRGAKQGALL